MIIHYFSNSVCAPQVGALKLKCVRMAQPERLRTLLVYTPFGNAMAWCVPPSLLRVVIAQQVILKYRANDVTRRTNPLRRRRAERKALLVILLGAGEY